MIKLGLPKEPFWLDIVPGVRFFVAPLDTVIFEAARRKANRQALEFLSDWKERKASDSAPASWTHLEDVDIRGGLEDYLFARALAEAAILEWEGVADMDGKPVGPGPDAIAEVMRVPKVTDQFLIRYSEPFNMLVSEGNG